MILIGVQKCVGILMPLSFCLAYGMVPEHNGPTLCRDLLVVIAKVGDGKVKNKLQKVDTYCNKAFSINNDSFLMGVDVAALAQQDKQSIYLRALWNNDEKIIERYRDHSSFLKLILVEDSVKYSGRSSCLTEIDCQGIRIIRKNLHCVLDKEKKIALGVEIENKIVGFGTDALSFNEMVRTLQIAALCGDIVTVEQMHRQLGSSARTLLTLSGRYVLARTLLLQAMKQNNMAIFKSLIEADPFSVFNIESFYCHAIFDCVCNTGAHLCGDVLDAPVHKKRKKQFFQVYQEMLTLKKCPKNKGCRKKFPKNIRSA